MNVEEYLEINGLNSIPYRQDVLKVMKEFAIDMCQKQREICAENAMANLEFYDEGSDDCEPIVNKDSIINSPLPEELQ